MTHPHTKPFSMADARAGAPIGLAKMDGGYTVEVLKYGDKKIFGILTNVHGDESPEYWNLDGTYGLAAVDGVLSLVMLPLGYCEGKPVFYGDELLNKGITFHADETGIGMDFDRMQYKWPKPEPKYPKTCLTHSQLHDAYTPKPDGRSGATWNSAGCEKLANEAIKHAIQCGDVFTKAQVTAVLEELRNICDRNANLYNIRQVVDGTDWDAILKGGL